MSTHNVCFCREIRKLSAFFEWKKSLICCYVCILAFSFKTGKILIYQNFIWSTVITTNIDPYQMPHSVASWNSVASWMGLQCLLMTLLRTCYKTSPPGKNVREQHFFLSLCSSICPSCQLLLKHWAEFHQTWYMTSSCGKDVRKQHYFYIYPSVTL